MVPVERVLKREWNAKKSKQHQPVDEPSLKQTNHGENGDKEQCCEEKEKREPELTKIKVGINICGSRSKIDRQSGADQ